MTDQRLTEDPLFLACTRPAMWQGVPLEAMVVNAMATTIVFVVMKNPVYMAVGVVMHYAVLALVARDYNMFGVLRLWSETKGSALNKDRWGGSSVSPLPVRRARRASEVRVHV